jgi:hypothetical protein
MGKVMSQGSCLDWYGIRTKRVKWRKQIFATSGIVDPNDEVGKLLQQFQNEIEKLCAPIVRRPFK